MAEPLSPERLAEIREWCDELGKSTSADGVGPYNAIRDLLAEVERLNVETERLTLERDWLDTQLRAARRTNRRHETEKVELGKSLTTQVAEVERLRAENAEQARVLASAGPEIKRLTERIVELEATAPTPDLVLPAKFVTDAMAGVPDQLPVCPVCQHVAEYCTCFGKTHRFEAERLGESDAKRRLARCVGCGQDRFAACHAEQGGAS